MGNFFKGIGKSIAEFFEMLVKGDIFTKLSAVIMGLGCLVRGQIARGLMFLFIEIMFIYYMIFHGSYWLSMLTSLGTNGPSKEYDAFLDVYVTKYNDNSFLILLYGILTIFIILAMVLVWAFNIKSSYRACELKKAGKKVNKLKDDIKDLTDAGFYKTLLFLPTIGIFIFTVLPIVFMIFVAFTNYDGAHDGYINSLFTWVGLDNFKTLFSMVGGTNSYLSTFGRILGWTLIWAFFATFSNYFLGIILAMMINRKGIKFKKMWRTIFVMTIAIPQFISLLYVSKMFDKSGIVNGWLMNLGWITQPIDFWGTATLARVMVILINIWVGIPYLMLIATGILMNIPQDLYEAAKIDGASPIQQFKSITMPYMLFITAPYLLTQFTGNMNNFNVIYLLTSGGPTNPAASSASGTVGYTDLLITWLFKITTGTESAYYLASVIGIVVFIIVTVISLSVYRILPSVKNEEGMQ